MISTNFSTKSTNLRTFQAFTFPIVLRHILSAEVESIALPPRGRSARNLPPFRVGLSLHPPLTQGRLQRECPDRHRPTNTALRRRSTIAPGQYSLTHWAP
ncbi:hypothetical protein AVEN_228616-1 [Araneus ventricosus]|uniref:Uncharacterized protein n=1 Tax=Araneus ventricosus TaxID=182803 RepID=A0A4Y2S366_ARAVE|nr:hypothetical protein AVEN_228616-1 [Araneus ventricosus]